MVVVEVLLELVVEQGGVVDDDTLELAVELLAIDPVRAFHLAVEPQGGGLDVDVADAAVGQVPVEGRLEFAPLSGLDHLDPERELVQR
jgi:hypothetical protein